MNAQLQAWMMLVARVFVGGMFLWVGVRKAFGIQNSIAFATKMGLVFPEILVPLAVALEIIAGIMIIVGYRTRLASIGFIIYLIILSPIFHGPWHFQGFAATQNWDQFMKNLSIIGMFFYIIVWGPGAYSLDAKKGWGGPVPAK